jgi:hypothetical protein
VLPDDLRTIAHQLGEMRPDRHLTAMLPFCRIRIFQ